METKELVNKILEGRSWTMQQLADHVGVNHSSVWRWIERDTPPHKHTIKLLEQELRSIERVKGK